MLLFSATILHSEWSFQKTNLTISPFDKKLPVVPHCAQKRDWNPPCGLQLSLRFVFCPSVDLPHCPLSLSWHCIEVGLFLEQVVFSPTPGLLHMLSELMEYPSLPSSRRPTSLLHFSTPLSWLFGLQISGQMFKETYFDTSKLLASLSSAYLLFSSIFILTILQLVPVPSPHRSVPWEHGQCMFICIFLPPCRVLTLSW